MKKNTLLLTLLTLLSFSAHTQVEKGMVLIGNSTNLLGNLASVGFTGLSNNAGFQFGKSKVKIEGSGFDAESETNVTSFNVSPNVGIFVSDHLLLGASLGYFYLGTKDENDNKDNLSVLTFAPVLRGYFKTEGKTLPFAELKGGILRIKPKDVDAQNSAFITAKAGTSFFLGKVTSLDLFVDYTFARSKQELDSDITITETSNQFGVGVGLSIYLDRKKEGDN